ncbi:hypothetical protein GCM10010466_29650 [Planomonospora alba]|uniref:Uncharacterized protein n=1 Tax=Planomonospora alba TaxID=161354 RepID=A0ABP6N574_9ACTN
MSEEKTCGEACEWCDGYAKGYAEGRAAAIEEIATGSEGGNHDQ